MLIICGFELKKLKKNAKLGEVQEPCSLTFVDNCHSIMPIHCSSPLPFRTCPSFWRTTQHIEAATKLLLGAKGSCRVSIYLPVVSNRYNLCQVLLLAIKGKRKSTLTLLRTVISMNDFLQGFEGLHSGLSSIYADEQYSYRSNFPDSKYLHDKASSWQRSSYTTS